ncbi:MAG: hypothetical protein RMK89_04985 [Armatimonadota bacterium]|nr:hypothetical protein [Armatimonadota bacterium]MDW8142799.1 hypothetical protein [Armatimonadota bacterium]
MWLASLVLSVQVALPPYPFAQTVSSLKVRLEETRIAPTNLSRNDYLSVINGIVSYFRRFQTLDGRIVDPFVHREVQYSTPCYAWAATALFISGRRPDLLESAAAALECSLEQLAEGKPADRHGDFFTFPAMLAYEHLRKFVPTERRQRWEQLLRAVDPYRAYRDLLTETRRSVHNWNVVAIAGEFLRYQAGFTDLTFVERYLEVQLQHFTPEGLYRDPNVPMAYDHFPRHFLAVMLERGYKGRHEKVLNELLERAAWTSLLIQSPLGELPTGGRSAQHQWNEAMQCVTYEIWAKRKWREGDKIVAKAFKRAAHLALQSVKRWVRPSGELWIVKNRFDPALRHGFEGYSFHSQYNLLAASMLATAWLFADERIPEGACPADVGGFVVHLPDFHKVIANAGGLYVEIDTAADPNYNSTGLLRVHKAGVEPLVGPSDGAAIKDEPLAVGIAWLEGDRWQPLAGLGRKQIANVSVSVHETKPQKVKFTVRYEINRPKMRAVFETYELTPKLVRVTTKVDGEVDKLLVRFPALTFDGQQETRIQVTGNSVTVKLGNSQQTFRVEEPSNVVLRRTGRKVRSRNGYLEPIEGEVEGKAVIYTLQPHSFAD